MSSGTKRPTWLGLALLLTIGASFVAARLEPGQFGLDRGSFVRGVLVDTDGKPLSGVVVALVPGAEGLGAPLRIALDRDGGRRTTTDGTGAFRFEAVDPGPHWIGPAATQDRPFDAPPVLHAYRKEPGVDLDGITLVVTRGVTLTGDVLSPESAAVEAGQLVAYHVDSHLRFETTIERDGTFTVGPVLPGEYRLQAQCPEAAFSSVVRHAAGARPVTLRLPGGSWVDLVLTLEGASEFPGLSALLRSTDQPAETLRGPFEWLDLSAHPFPVAAGTYELTVATGDGHVGRVPEVHVEPGGRDVEVPVDLSPGALVEVDVTHDAVEWYTLTLEGAWWGGSRRDFPQPHWVPPGSVVVRGWSYRGVEVVQRVAEARVGVPTRVEL